MKNLKGHAKKLFPFLKRLEADEFSENPFVKKFKKLYPHYPPREAEVLAALSGLLSRTALSDEDLDETELTAMKSSLKEFTSIEEKEIHSIVDLAVQNYEHLKNYPQGFFAAHLRKALKAEAKLEVLNLLFAVALADGVIQNSELDHVKQATRELGLNLNDYHHARNAVLAKLDLVI